MSATAERGLSKFLQSSVARAKLSTTAKALDAPAGYGRHAHWLSQAGYSVVAIDWDTARIERASRTAPATHTEIIWRVGNLEDDSEVFDGTFDLMVCIHYFSDSIIERAFAALKPGGFLILETFGGQGQNWKGLPRKGWVATALAQRFEVISLKEIPVGPVKENVALKVLARKRFS